MKKRLSLLLALVLILPLFASVALAEGDAVELNFWYWDTSMDDCYKEMFDAFTAENPNITVKLSQTPWADYWTKLQTALPSGSGPDIFWLNHPNAVTYLPTGLVSSIQDAVDGGSIDMTPFAQSLYDPYTLDGSLYCIPIFFDTIGIAYNKQMLADAGYPDGPPADWTWDDMLEIAQKLTTDDVYGISSNSNSQSYSMDFILQNGGQLYTEDGLTCTLDSDENVEAIQFLLDLMYKYNVSPTQAEQTEVTALDRFQNDMLAMMPFGLWNIKPTVEAMGEDAFDIAPMPQKAQKGTIVHNLGYAMSTSANQEAGLKLMEYFASKDHGDRIATVFAPAHQESQQIWFDTFPTLNLNVFTDGLEYAQGLMISSKNAGQTYSLYETEVERLFLNYTEDTDVKAELTKISETITAEIAK